VHNEGLLFVGPLLLIYLLLQLTMSMFALHPLALALGLLPQQPNTHRTSLLVELLELSAKTKRVLRRRTRRLCLLLEVPQKVALVDLLLLELLL
jgi:hypothetical protein